MSKEPPLKEMMLDVFGPGGRLGRVLKNPEVRPGQIEMAQRVADTLEMGRFLAIEAGTGTGKSLGALVPAALYSARHKKRVVIATHTITLQEQLIQDDLPILQQVLGSDVKVKVTLMKGRRNYVCKRKVFEARSHWYNLSFKTPAAAAVFRRTVDHIVEHDAGDKESLPFFVSPEVWEPIQSDSDSCLGKDCKFFWSCHYFKAQREAQKADIIVTNQALLFTDLALKASGSEGLLPPYDVLILDEAHHLEDVATSAWQVTISMVAMFEPIARLFRALSRSIGKRRGGGDVAEMGAVLLDAGQKFLDSLGSAELVREPYVDYSELRQAQKDLDYRLEFMLQSGALPDDAKTLAESARVRLVDMIVKVSQWAKQSSKDYAYWVSEDRFGRKAAEMAPVDVSRTLKEHLFHDEGPKVICMSATLSKELLDRCGFEVPRVERVQSPFDLAKQALLYSPLRALNPARVRAEQYDAYLAQEVQGLIEASEGRSLVLFTSWSAMERVYELTAGRLESLGYTPLRQGGELSRSELLTRFREDRHSCLFGLLSFWEGVDVPGDALSTVIITRLPFSVPTDPLGVARAELMKKRGQDPFLHLAVPEALIRFRQGFGRLIRSSSDRGVVACLDGRFLSTSWGKQFRESVAEVPGTRNLAKVSNLLGVPLVGRTGTEG